LVGVAHFAISCNYLCRRLANPVWLNNCRFGMQR
jgi:hypothetical protein